MKNEKKLSFELIIMKAEIWFDIVILQVNRILKENEVVNNLTEEEKLIKSNWNMNTKRIADEHFLKVALLKSEEWLKELSLIMEEGDEWLGEIKKHSDIRVLRDIAEHEIDYYKGNGYRHKEKFVNNFNGLNALETGILDDDYLIGGRLSLNQIKKSFECLKEKISKHRFTVKIECIKEFEQDI